MEDKIKLAQKNEDSLRFTDEAMKSKEVIINEYKAKNEKLERKLMECCREINKGNEIIENLKNDLSKKKESIKTKNEVIKMQEAKISSLNDSILKAKSEVTDIERTKDSKDREIASLNRVIEDLESKLKQADKINQESQASKVHLPSDLLLEQENDRGIRSTVLRHLLQEAAVCPFTRHFGIFLLT